MKRMNNKGQVLVSFILMIPILLLMVLAITDVSLLSLEKRKVNNTVRDTVKYGIKNINKDNIKDTMHSLILSNIKEVDSAFIIVDAYNNYVKAKVLVNYKGLIGINNGKITVEYYATVKDGEIKIIKEG